MIRRSTVSKRTGTLFPDTTLFPPMRRSNFMEIVDLSGSEGRALPACLKRAGHIDPDGECLSQEHPKLDPIHTSHSVADISYIKGNGSPRCQIDARRDANDQRPGHAVGILGELKSS